MKNKKSVCCTTLHCHKVKYQTILGNSQKPWLSMKNILMIQTHKTIFVWYAQAESSSLGIYFKVNMVNMVNEIECEWWYTCVMVEQIIMSYSYT